MSNEKYTTIKTLVTVMSSERHLINCMIDRSGATIADSDVIRKIEDDITYESRYMDGFLRGHTDVPIIPTLTALTGTLTFVNGSTILNGVGTLFLTELLPGDEIRLDGEPEVRVHVKSISSDLILYTDYVYYGLLSTDTASKYTSNVPFEVDNAMSRHIAWKVWQRNGRIGDNPHEGDETYFRQLVKDIKSGLYRFDTAGGSEVSRKPTRYKTNTHFDMSDHHMKGFIPK